MRKNKISNTLPIKIACLALAVLILLLSCPNNTAQPPIINKVFPSDDESDVSLNSIIIIFFSQPMNTQVIESGFSIAPKVDGAFQWEGKNSVLKFVPNQSFTPGTKYIVMIEIAVSNTSLNSTFAPFAWSFTTAAASSIDTTPPDPVTSPTATPGDSAITMGWSNPTNPDFAGVKILRRTDYNPTSINDGSEVYNGTGITYVDTGLSNGVTYYYTLFSYDAAGNYSSGVSVNATPVGTLTEMIVNGDFSNGLAGWTFVNYSTGGGTAGATIDTGRLKVDAHLAYGNGGETQSFASFIPHNLQFDFELVSSGCSGGRIHVLRGASTILRFHTNHAPPSNGDIYTYVFFNGTTYYLAGPGSYYNAGNMRIEFDTLNNQILVFLNSQQRLTIPIPGGYDLHVDAIELLGNNGCADGRNDTYMYYDNLSFQ